jgi:hypothetical protein
MMFRFIPLTRTLLACLAILGCSSSTGPNYDPVIPTAWANAVTNPFFPLVAGTTLTYLSQLNPGVESTSVAVLAQPKVIMGVSSTEVRDQVFQNGVLIEDTFDWYAQDDAGNVWYLGEDSKQYQNGQLIGTEGSWQWGVQGALPGIIMWADPAAHTGESYRQEFLRDVAQDRATVLTSAESVTVPYGTLSGCIKTEDWSELDFGTPHENKYYCPQLGVVLETTASGERVELVSKAP